MWEAWVVSGPNEAFIIEILCTLSRLFLPSRALRSSLVGLLVTNEN
jgi:hypothetical protein